MKISFFKKTIAAALSVFVMGGTLPAVQFAAPVMTSFAEEEVLDEVVINGMTFSVYSDHAELWWGDATMKGDIVIPAEVGGVPLTIINAELQSAEDITSITIPETVRRIEGYSFANCNIKSVTIPEGVETIDGSVFNGCSALETLSLPASLSSFSVNCLRLCCGMKKITVNEENPYYSAVDGVLFNKKHTELFFYPPAKSNTEYTIPDSVTSISNLAFMECNNLDSLTIPASVTEFSDFSIGTYSLETSNVHVVIRGYEGSTAQAYAEQHGLTFESLGEAPGTSEGTTVSVTIADGTGALPVLQQPVTVTDIDFDGWLTINDALYLAHEKYYDGGAAAGYSSSRSTWGLGIDKLWGIENGGIFGYYVNDVSAYALDDPVSNGDSIYAFVFSDTSSFTDTYCFFNAKNVQARTGSPVSLILNQIKWDSSGSVTVPLSADITINGEPSGQKTDENGRVSLTFDEPGDYVISASSEEVNIVPPAAVIHVTSGAPSGVTYGDVNGDSEVNLNDAVAILQYIALSAKYPIEGDALEAADVCDNGTSGINGNDALAIMMVDAKLLSADKLPVDSKTLAK